MKVYCVHSGLGSPNFATCNVLELEQIKLSFQRWIDTLETSHTTASKETGVVSNTAIDGYH